MIGELKCSRCGNEGTPRLEIRTYTADYESRRHIGAYCTACESWIKWVPQNAEWVDAFNRQHDHPMYPHEKRTLQVTE